MSGAKSSEPLSCNYGLSLTSECFDMSSPWSITADMSLHVDGPVVLLAALFQAVMHLSLNDCTEHSSESSEKAKKMSQRLKDDVKVIHEKLSTIIKAPLKAAITCLRKAAMFSRQIAGEKDEQESTCAEAEKEALKAIDLHHDDSEILIQTYYVNVIAKYEIIVGGRRTVSNLKRFQGVIKGLLQDLFRNAKIINAIQTQAAGGSFFGNKKSRCKIIRSLTLLCRCVDNCFRLPSSDAADATVLEECTKLVEELHHEYFAIQYKNKDLLVTLDGRFLNLLGPSPTPLLDRFAFGSDNVVVMNDFIALIVYRWKSESVPLLEVHQVSTAKMLYQSDSCVCHVFKVTDNLFVTFHPKTCDAQIWRVDESGVTSVRVIENVISSHGGAEAQRLTDDYLFFPKTHKYERYGIYQIKFDKWLDVPFLRKFTSESDGDILNVIPAQNADATVAFHFKQKLLQSNGQWLLWRSNTNDVIGQVDVKPKAAWSGHYDNYKTSIQDCRFNDLLIDSHSEWLFSVSQCKYIRPLTWRNEKCKSGMHCLTKLSHNEVLWRWDNSSTCQVWRITDEHDELVSEFEIEFWPGISSVTPLQIAEGDPYIVIQSSQDGSAFILNYRSGKLMGSFSIGDVKILALKQGMILAVDLFHLKIFHI